MIFNILQLIHTAIYSSYRLYSVPRKPSPFQVATTMFNYFSCITGIEFLAFSSAHKLFSIRINQINSSHQIIKQTNTLIYAVISSFLLSFYYYPTSKLPPQHFLLFYNFIECHTEVSDLRKRIWLIREQMMATLSSNRRKIYYYCRPKRGNHKPNITSLNN